MELREVEDEAREHDEKAEDMTREVEDHKEKADQLEEAVQALREAQQEIDSEGVRGALAQAEQAKQATEERLTELRTQKEDLLTRNAEMQDQCITAFERKKQAVEKMPFLQQRMRAEDPDADVASGFYKQMETALEEDMNRTAGATRDLENVRVRLEQLDL
jgi:chromosome segregation ATPase